MNMISFSLMGILGNCILFSVAGTALAQNRTMQCGGKIAVLSYGDDGNLFVTLDKMTGSAWIQNTSEPHFTRLFSLLKDAKAKDSEVSLRIVMQSSTSELSCQSKDNKLIKGVQVR